MPSSACIGAKKLTAETIKEGDCIPPEVFRKLHEQVNRRQQRVRAYAASPITLFAPPCLASHALKDAAQHSSTLDSTQHFAKDALKKATDMASHLAAQGVHSLQEAARAAQAPAKAASAKKAPARTATAPKAAAKPTRRAPAASPKVAAKKPAAKKPAAAKKAARGWG